MSSSNDKLLAEWFWIDRWMGSNAFLLPMEARGIYREMLSQAWRRGARLPNDHEAIQRAIGCTSKEWRRSWPLIAGFWERDAEGFMFNATQQQVYREALAKRDKYATRGKAGAKERWKDMLKHQVSNAQALPSPMPSDVLEQCPPSPSPSPITERTRTGRENAREATALAEPDPPLDVAFERFKAAYPGHRRVDNFMTRQRFIDACLKVTTPVVFARLHEQKQSREWQRGMVPSMQKWFEDKHYEREPAPVVPEMSKATASVVEALQRDVTYD